MKNKGFTLIELLAVIVILAIIALIATPIILGIINDARNSAKDRSAELVYTGVEYAYTTAMYKKTEFTQDVTLAEIAQNFNVENAPDGMNETTGVIETVDGVTCTVAAAADGFTVTCDNPHALAKTVYTK